MIRGQDKEMESAILICLFRRKYILIGLGVTNI